MITARVCSSRTLQVVTPIDEVVDRVMATYNLIHPFNAPQFSESRDKITLYLEKLTAGGQTDLHQLAVFGLAYLKELHDGPNPRYTGC